MPVPEKKQVFEQQKVFFNILKYHYLFKQIIDELQILSVSEPDPWSGIRDACIVFLNFGSMKENI